MMNLIRSSAIIRKQQLIMEETLERATGKGTAPFTPGETWRNNKFYLIDDSVKDSNGNPYTNIKECRNKPPANSPDFWKPDTQAHIQRWADIAVGATIQITTEVIHNSKNWVCAETHVKTAGNGPRAGSTIWLSK